MDVGSELSQSIDRYWALCERRSRDLTRADIAPAASLEIPYAQEQKPLR